MTFPAFRDSVDSTAKYPNSYCGEKIVTLDPNAPSFLTLTKGSDPLIDPFTITLDKGALTLSDIGEHSIGYTVSFKNYPYLPTEYAYLTFELSCPTVTKLTDDGKSDFSPIWLVDLPLDLTVPLPLF